MWTYAASVWRPYTLAWAICAWAGDIMLGYRESVFNIMTPSIWISLTRNLALSFLPDKRLGSVKGKIVTFWPVQRCWTVEVYVVRYDDERQRQVVIIFNISRSLCDRSDQVVSRSGKHMDTRVSYAVISRWPLPSTRHCRSLPARPVEGRICGPSGRAVSEAYRL